ncbi:MAG: hypothetical protein P9C55_12655 [Defluviicoccus sp.]|nr:hypothetical protein [Defluviicoccus sp.]
MLEDAIYAHRWQNSTDPLDNRLDILALYHRESVPEPSLVRVEFHGAAAHQALFEEVLNPKTRRAWKTDRLDAHAVVTEGLYCRFADRIGSESTALSALADLLLDHLLIGNRPLRAWRTAFMQPLRVRDRARFDDERLVLLDTATDPPRTVPTLGSAFADAEERSYFSFPMSARMSCRREKRWQNSGSPPRGHSIPRC